jgi:integrase
MGSKLTARGAQNAPVGWHCDGRGLYLQCTPGAGDSVNRSWVYRYRAGERERYMGLGPLADVSLAEAREKALAARKLRLEGIDPIEHKRGRQNELRLAASRRVTFGQCVETFLEFKQHEWTNPKHAEQWAMTLRSYAKPLHPFSPDAIDLALVVKTLQPIWTRIPETAGRTRQRIEAVLDHWAATNEILGYSNPAAWERVKHALPSLAKIKKGKHHSALPYAELPAFMAELRGRDSLSALALEFTILCAARTGEVIGAERDEIDFDAKTWTIPAARMKAGMQHKVPLSDRAVEILNSLPRKEGRIFPLSNMAMLQLLRGMRPGLTVHGFRSTFMDWAHECTSYPKTVIDMSLAHKVGDKVEAAYRRGDLFAKRAKLMAQWAEFCAKPPISPVVIPLRDRA